MSAHPEHYHLISLGSDFGAVIYDEAMRATDERSSSPTYPSRSFEGLPSEVLLQVLENLNSLSNVYSVIRASPVAFRVFRHRKATVLASAIRCSIHPTVLPLAITVCDAACDNSFSVRSTAWKMAKKESHDPNYAYFNSWLHRFYKYVHRTASVSGRNAHQKVDGAETYHIVDSRLKDLSLVLSLCRLWSVTEFFIRGYPNERFHICYPNEAVNRGPKPVSSLPSVANLGLSESEYGRLQRGFFHFELYRHLFSGLNRYGWSSIDKSTLSPHYCMFNSCLADAEKGELSSIQQHLLIRVNLVLDSVYGYLIAKIGDIGWRKYRLMDILIAKIFGMERNLYWQFEIVESALIELGLPFVRDFIKMKNEERLAVAELCASQNRQQTVLSYSKSYNYHQWETARDAKYHFIHQLQQRQQNRLMFDLTQEGRSRKSNWLSAALMNDWLSKSFGFPFWDDARQCDHRSIVVFMGVPYSSHNKENIAKMLTRPRVGVIDATVAAPDTTLKMKDFIRLIDLLEY